MGRYRKKPVEVDAIQWNGDLAALKAFLIHRNRVDAPSLWTFDGAGELWAYVEKSQKQCHVERGGWIIAEPDGVGVYPCTAANFEATYEAVS